MWGVCYLCGGSLCSGGAGGCADGAGGGGLSSTLTFAALY